MLILFNMSMCRFCSIHNIVSLLEVIILSFFIIIFFLIYNYYVFLFIYNNNKFFFFGFLKIHMETRNFYLCYFPWRLVLKWNLYGSAANFNSL